MLLIVEEGIRGGICQATHRYAKANYKYMKNYDNLEYLDANKLYGYAISQKLPVDNLKWTEKHYLLKFDENVIKNDDQNSDIGYILELYVEYPKSLHNLHSDLAFLPERMKINKYTKLLSTVQDKEKYVVHVLPLK